MLFYRVYYAQVYGLRESAAQLKSNDPVNKAWKFHIHDIWGSMGDVIWFLSYSKMAYMCRWDCWVKLGPFPCRRATLSAAADSTLASVYKKKIDPIAWVNISRACADCLKQRWRMLWL